MALEHDGTLMMDKKKKALIAVGVILAVVVVVGLITNIFATSDAKKKQSKVPTNFFTSDTTTQQKSSNSTTAPSTTTTTRPGQTPSPAKAKLNELPLTAFLDPHYPETYLSYRYEVIINGEFQGDALEDTYLYHKIAITELDDPANSDLPAATFTQLRALAIATAKAQATGENTSAYPDYFTPSTYVDKCTSFSAVAAGAISMPYPNDDSWALGVVYWKATCTIGASGSAPVVLTSHQNIFMHRGPGGFVPVPTSALPRA